MDSGCLRHMTGVKSYLHKYVEQPGPKVFDEKRGTIFNSNKEVVMIAPTVRDVYVLDMTSSAQESCLFAKASENLNWLWHKILAHLNLKTINKLAKQNLVIVYIHNHKDHLGKFDEKVGDGYLLEYSLVSKSFRVFYTRRQQTEETYHITFDESLDAIKFSKSLVNNINIAENEIYPPDEYLHPYEPFERVEDTLVKNTILIPNPSLSIPSMVTPALQYRYSQDKHIELVNIIGNPGAEMLTRAIAKQRGAASAISL
nr:retrovirus-related Pol polyprotein from transposon TNT 1-94 [Tanacetum cinerariifolium]